MGFAWTGAKLRLIQRGDEERMVGPLDRPDLVQVVDSGHRHAMGAGEIGHREFEPVVAGCVLNDGFGVVMELCQPGTGGGPKRDVGAVNRACQQRNDRGTAGSVFGMGSVVDAGL